MSASKWMVDARTLEDGPDAAPAIGLASLTGAAFYADLQNHEKLWLIGYGLVLLAGASWLWSNDSPVWVIVLELLAGAATFVFYWAFGAPIWVASIITAPLLFLVFQLPSNDRPAPGAPAPAELSPEWTRADALGERADWQRGRWS